MKIIVKLFLILSIISNFHALSVAEDVVIAFTGEEYGNMEPCGCFEGQVGGISRRHTFLNLLRNKEKTVIAVSLGDLPKYGGHRQQEIKTEFLLRAMEKMGYVLHNIGEKDIEIGPHVLSYLSQTNGVKLLSSNVVIESDFPVKIYRYITEEYQNFNIAFLGILSRSLLDASVSDYIRILDPVDTLRSLVNELKDKADFMVLLSHTSVEDAMELAGLFPEIRLIITGHKIEDPLDSITYVNDTLIISPGKHGRYVGAVTYSVLDGNFEKASVKLVQLGQIYGNSEEMLQLLREYQQVLRVEDLLSKVQQIPVAGGLTFAGNAACGVCHKKVYNHWSETRHGAAYNTLVRTGHQYDPECISCHTTGYGYVSGFLTYEKNPDLINVGCEGCHGAGSEHINNINKSYGSTGKGTCEVCHNNEHSPSFQFSEYWEKIKHPEEKVNY